MKDRNEIIPLLHTLRRPTFLTRMVARIHESRITFWQVGVDESSKLDW